MIYWAAVSQRPPREIWSCDQRLNCRPLSGGRLYFKVAAKSVIIIQNIEIIRFVLFFLRLVSRIAFQLQKSFAITLRRFRGNGRVFPWKRQSLLSQNSVIALADY